MVVPPRRPAESAAARAAARIAATSSIRPFSTTRTNAQRFVRDIGRDSTISTRSPMCDSLFSSCTWQIVLRRTYLPYRGCLTSRGISTRRVLAVLSLVTIPVSTRLGMGLFLLLDCLRFAAALAAARWF